MNPLVKREPFEIHPQSQGNLEIAPNPEIAVAPLAAPAAFAAANRGQARIFEARHQGATVAALLFLCHGAVATYHIGWSGPEGRARAAHHLLLWRAMIDLAARGITRLDLGMVDTVTAPGLARFKLGSGARCRALGGTWLARA